MFKVKKKGIWHDGLVQVSFILHDFKQMIFPS